MLNLKNVKFIPISAWHGENLIDPCPFMPWYKGPTLMEAIEEFKEPRIAFDTPLRFIPFNLFKKGKIMVGKVKSGLIRKNDTIINEHNKCIVKSLEFHHKDRKFCFPGQIIGVCMDRALEKSKKDKRVIFTSLSDKLLAVTDFTAQLVINYHPRSIKAGYGPTLYCSTARSQCTFKELLWTLDKNTGEKKEPNPESVKKGDHCIVQLKLPSPLSLTSFQKKKDLQDLLSLIQRCLLL